MRLGVRKRGRSIREVARMSRVERIERGIHRPLAVISGALIGRKSAMSITG